MAWANRKENSRKPRGAPLPNSNWQHFSPFGSKGRPAGYMLCDMPMPDNHKCQVQITKGVDKKRKGGKVALETLVAVKKRMAFDGHSPIASTQSRVKRSQIESRANSIMRT